MKKAIRVFALLISAFAYGAHNASNDGVFPYNVADRKEVYNIARANLKSLASGYMVTTKQVDRLMNSEICRALDESLVNPADVICNVYKRQGNPVGFITYRIYTPWYEKIIPCSKKDSAAHIFHLAVSSAHRGKGYGSSLLESVIHDCKNKEVSHIKLYTTPAGELGNLRQFYEKFEFQQTFLDARRGHKYTLHLKPQIDLIGIARKAIGLVIKRLK